MARPILSMNAQAIDRLLHFAHRTTSLDQPVSSDSSTSLADFLGDIGLTAEQNLIKRDRVKAVLEAVRCLPAQEMNVLVLRLGLSGEPRLTLNRIGERLGLSRERVRQIEKQAKQRLWRALRRKGRPGAKLSSDPPRE